MKVVAFDLDETLLDRTASLADFCNWQATDQLKNDISSPDKYISRFLELDAHGSVWKDIVYEKLVDEFSIKSFSADELLDSYINNFYKFCKAKENAVEAIKQLSSIGYKLALVTNGPSPFQERNFKALGIGDYFSTVLVSESVGYSKPDKRIFLLLCTKLGVSPQECIFVGDNPKSDIEGASALGMYSVFIPGPISNSCSLANVECCDFRLLPQIVQNAS